MEENIEKYINNIKDIKLSDVDNEFIKYLTLFKERFGRNAYISEPNGTKEQTIEAIKICLEKNEDILMSYGFTNSAISGHTEGK